MKDQLFIFGGKRVGPGVVFKTFMPIRPGQVIDVDSYDNIRLIKFEPWTDHKHSLDMLKGI